MILGIKDYVIGGLGVALALSLWGNQYLSGKVDEANQSVGAAHADAENAKDVAGMCSRSVAKMEEDQRERERLAKPAVEASKGQQQEQQGKAATILTTAPTKPGNDCQSAKDRASTWLKGRTK